MGYLAKRLVVIRDRGSRTHVTVPVDLRPSAPCVLLVEDFRDTREMYHFYLTKQGYRVEVAEDGHAALRVALEQHPDLILMDLGLPGIDGWTVIDRLKRDTRTCTIPIVVLSAHPKHSASQRAADAGCTGYLSKPCPPRDVANEIVRVLGATGADVH